ncbi:MAG TPA: hypothetical protein GYA08_02785 [Chloroflexi bacterium]|nr:hypothetical protein [Chloroflexota bacterium]
MVYLLVLIIGILIGWLMTWYWSVIRKRWESSKSLRSSYDKTVKEIADKGKKAREDRRKSRTTALRAFVETALFWLLIVVMVVLAANLIGLL